MQPEWFTVITLIGVVESTIALSFLPAFRSNWKRWKRVDWDAEFPFVAPAYNFNGGVWFLLGLVNALGLWRLIRLNETEQPVYHIGLTLWLASFFVLSIWGIPFEYKTPVWSFLAIFVSSLFSFGTSTCALVLLLVQEINSALSAVIILYIYSALLFLPSAFQLFLWCVRASNPEDYKKLRLHKKTANPFTRYLKEQGWPPVNL